MIQPASRTLPRALLLVAAFFATATATGAQSDDASVAQALAAISPATVRAHVEFLSHDLLEGRDTGSRGYEIAREYVASQFRRMGLQPAFGDRFVQDVPLLSAGEDAGSSLRVGTVAIDSTEAAIAPDWTGRAPAIAAPAVYVGFGLVAKGRDDYRGVDVRDRLVLMLPGVPEAWVEDPVGSLQSRLKMIQALQRGAAGVIVLQLEGNLPGNARTLALADGTSPSPRALATVGPAATARILTAIGIRPEEARTVATAGAAPREAGPATVTRARRVGPAVSWNVGGVVPGSDPAVRHETVVFTAHLDHVGIGEPDENGDRIFNGTHDNALGIGKLLASAEAMVRLKPRRTVVFVAVGAEERGLLGSWHYVNHPVGRTEDIVANINHDGGLEGAAPDDVFAFGVEYSELDGPLREAASGTGMRLVTEPIAPFSISQGLLFRSDHYSFLARGVPGIYLMDGFTVGGDPTRGRDQWDVYLRTTNHKQRDNFDPGWTFEAPVRMAALSVRLAWRLANDAGRPRMRPGAPFIARVSP